MTTSPSAEHHPRTDRAIGPRMSLAREARSSYQAMRELDLSLAEYGLDRRLIFPAQTRVSQINRCAFCIDMHIKEAVHLGDSIHRSYGRDVRGVKHSYYLPEERAALALAEAMTTLAPGRYRTHLGRGGRTGRAPAACRSRDDDCLHQRLESHGDHH